MEKQNQVLIKQSYEWNLIYSYLEMLHLPEDEDFKEKLSDLLFYVDSKIAKPPEDYDIIGDAYVVVECKKFIPRKPNHRRGE